MTIGLLAGTATVAAATDATEDSRASVESGNATTCTGGQHPAGLDGERVAFDQGDVEEGDTYLTITGVPDGYEITGIVVKGGNGYNLYVPGTGGLDTMPPWEKLRSPLNGGGNVPQISHWFACGTRTAVTTSTTPSESVPPSDDETPSSESETPGGTASTPQETSTAESSMTSEAGPGAVTTTSRTPAPVVGDTDELASTGFGGGWLIGLVGLLLAGGGALLALARIRRRKA
jgi:hypothetical protein